MRRAGGPRPWLAFALVLASCNDQIIGALPLETTGATDDEASTGEGAGTSAGATTEAASATTAGEPAAGVFVAVGERARRLTTLDLGETWPYEQLGLEGDPEQLLRAVTVGESRVVAVGGLDFGRSAASDDGVSWEVAEDALPVLQDVVYGNGTFVAVGVDGRRARSTDGLVWEEVPVDELDFFVSIAFGAGVFVTTGYNGVRLRSVDGWTWTDRVLEFGEGYTDVVHGNGRFLAISRDSGRVVVSEDGAEWSSGAALGTLGKGLCFGDGVFLALGEGVAHRSPDGLEWTSAAAPVELERCAYGEGRFLALAYPDARWRSLDGVAWEPLDEDAAQGPALGDIAFVP